MDTNKGIIFDLRKYSIHDGPGIRTTVFFKGCALSCWWCHNPEGQSAAPELMFRENRCIRCGTCFEVCLMNAVQELDGIYQIDEEHCIMCGDCIEKCPGQAREIAGRTATVEEVMGEIEKDIPFYDESGGGVTFSGGEPLAQRHFLLRLLRACQAKDIHTTLDTCGLAAWEVMDSVRPYVDLFLFDVKLVDEQKHMEYTGVSNQLILANLRKLAEQGHDIIIRVPLIPGITDTEDNIRAIGELAASLPNIHRVDLLPYHETAVQKYRRMGRSYHLEGTGPEPDEVVTRSVAILEARNLAVTVGG